MVISRKDVLHWSTLIVTLIPRSVFIFFTHILMKSVLVQYRWNKKALVSEIFIVYSNSMRLELFYDKLEKSTWKNFNTNFEKQIHMHSVYTCLCIKKKKKRYQMLKLLLNYYMCTSPTTISKINGVYFITIKEKVKDST